uniref:Uncharacterized protein n=1 Tax=Physcomitrium patens TaxID=3218 RepID=A0A2K1KQ38_PHYPA|nr:hypothetical protein PHYPA_006810 [Physcomitrium patens]
MYLEYVVLQVYDQRINQLTPKYCCLTKNRTPRAWHFSNVRNTGKQAPPDTFVVLLEGDQDEDATYGGLVTRRRMMYCRKSKRKKQ